MAEYVGQLVERDWGCRGACGGEVAVFEQLLSGVRWAARGQSKPEAPKAGVCLSCSPSSQGACGWSRVRAVRWWGRDISDTLGSLDFDLYPEWAGAMEGFWAGRDMDQIYVSKRCLQKEKKMFVYLLIFSKNGTGRKIKSWGKWLPLGGVTTGRRVVGWGWDLIEYVLGWCCLLIQVVRVCVCFNFLKIKIFLWMVTFMGHFVSGCKLSALYQVDASLKVKLKGAGNNP